jgi:hypothetical protein
LNIADVTFTITNQNLKMMEWDVPGYQTFLGNGGGDIDVFIQLELGGMPARENLRKIYDGGQSLEVFTGEGLHERVLMMSASDSNEPLWMARLDLDSTEVSVHCGRRLITSADGSTVVNALQVQLDRRLVMYVLGRRKGMIVHAAGLEWEGRGYLFPGKSGAGKSTLSRLFATGRGFEMLSDDRIVVRKMGGAFRSYGTPWPGDAGFAVNKGVPLSGMFFIHKGPQNVIHEISPKEALERLFPVGVIPWYEKEMVPDFLDFCEYLVSSVPVYDLHFRPDQDVANYFLEFISANATV